VFLVLPLPTALLLLVGNTLLMAALVYRF